MITVWGRVSSSNVQATLWCLAELGLEFERIDAGFVYGVTDTPAYLEMNPNGFVPTLVDGENPPLFETGAILRYLATAHGDDVFWPSGLVARAQIDKWAEWAKINIALKFTAPVFWLVIRTARSLQDPEQIAQSRYPQQIPCDRRYKAGRQCLYRRAGLHAGRHPDGTFPVPLFRYRYPARQLPASSGLL